MERDAQRRFLQRMIDFLDDQRPLRSLLAESNHAVGTLRLSDIAVLPRLSPYLPSQLDAPPNLDETDGAGSGAAVSPRFRPNLVELLRESLDAGDPVKVGILGHMGAGKSTLLQGTARYFAEHALDDPNAPVPILIDAHALVDTSHAGGSHRELVPETERIQSGSGPLIWFIDGYDEVARTRRAECTRALHRLAAEPTTKGIVLTMRPVRALPLLSDYTWLQIEPWSSHDIESFLERCAQWLSGSEVDHARAFIEHHPALATSPLTSTLILSFARQGHDAAHTRADLFRRMTEWVFSQWSDFRRRDEPHWRDLESTFSQLALDSVRTHQFGIEQEQLRALLNRCAPGRTERMLQWSMDHFGLLVSRGDGYYQFVLRPLAEFLAGVALREVSDDERLAMALSGWAEEPLRHWAGLVALEEHVEHAARFVKLLLLQARQQKHSAHMTRCVVLASVIALDLGEKAHPVATAVAAALHRLVTNESSNWIPRIASEIIRDMSTAGGPCWHALMPRLEAEVERFSEHDWDALSDRWGLFHRLPRARAAAIRRMNSTIDRPAVQWLMFRVLFEPLMVNFNVDCPPVEAGLALRLAPRNEFFRSQIQPRLVGLLKNSNQSTAGGAACALRPGEANLDQHAAAIMHLASAGVAPQSVISELRDYPGGPEALARAQPHAVIKVNGVAQDPLATPWPLPRTHSDSTTSRFVQEHILKGIGPRLEELSESARACILDSGDTPRNSHYIEFLCEIAADQPQHLKSVLRRSEYAFFTPAAQEHLHRAVLLHPELFDTLLDWIQGLQPPSRHVYQYFPFRSIEGLVLLRDERAVDLFCRYFATAIGVVNPRPLDPRLFEVPSVRQAAIDHARYLVEHVDPGVLTESGERSWLAPRVAGNFLGAMRSAWMYPKDEFVSDGVRGWLDSAVDERVIGALKALGPRMDASARQQLGRLLAHEPNNPTQVEMRIRVIECALDGGFIPNLRPELSAIAVKHGHPLQPAAVAGLTAFVPVDELDADPEMKGAIEALVRTFPYGKYAFFYDRDPWVLPLLMTARWHLWIDRLRDQAQSSLLDLQTVRILASVLSPENQAALMKFVVRRLGHQVLPWTLDLPDRRPERLGDAYQQLLYRLGVDATSMSEAGGRDTRQRGVHSTTQMRIFISYRHTCSKHMAGRIADLLRDKSYSVFIDQNSITAGERWDTEIQQQLKSASVIIAVIGPGWLGEDDSGLRKIDQEFDWVRMELRHALTAKALVVPIVEHIDHMPTAGQLPDDIAELSRLQALEIRPHHFQHDAQLLLDRLAETR